MSAFPFLLADGVVSNELMENTVTPEAIDTLSTTITNNGILVVIAAVFLLVFIAIFVMFLRMNSTMMNNIMKQITESNNNITNIVGNLVNAITNQQNSTQKIDIKELDEIEDLKKEYDEDRKSIADMAKKDLLKLYIDYTFAFKAACKIALEETKADRVAIYLFHNSNKTPYGFHFIKVSCVYELTENGTITARGRKHNSIPMHIYNDFIHEIYRDKEYTYCAADTDNQETSGIKEFISDSKVRSVFINAISREDGAIVGFVCAEFDYDVDLNKENDTYKKVHTSINNMILSISHIVTNEDFHKQYEDLHKNKEN